MSRRPRAGYVKDNVAMFEEKSGTQPRTSDVKPASATPVPTKHSVVRPFPGYEQKEASSIPLVFPDDYKYDAVSYELKKVDKALTRSKLVPCLEALKLLESIKKPLAVLTICGPARGGKSYILSRILGRHGAFKLGHTMRPQTYGVWMGTHYLDFDDYAMILLDTEGTDAVGAKNKDDLSVLLLATLLSSCLIYNSKNVPSERDLQTMEWFTRLSSAIAIKQSKKDKAQESDHSHIRHVFPDFVWLLRDVTLEIPEKESGEPMTPREFMLDYVFENNKEVGKALENFFATVDCKILPHPGGSLKKEEASLDSQFIQDVQKFIVYIHGKARAKKGFQEGERVEGPILSMLVSSYLEAINDPNAKPCLESAWKSVVQMRCLQVIADLVKEYEAEMRKELTGKLPIEIAADPKNPKQPSLMQIHGDILRRMLDKLREATQYCMPADPSASEIERRKLSDQLTGEIIQTEQPKEGSVTTGKVVGGVLYKLMEENHRMSHKHCAKVFDEVSQSIRDCIKTAESDPTSTASLNDTMPDKIKWLQLEYYDKATGPAKEEVLELKLKELNEYGSRVAGFQKMVIDREALAEKRRIEELKGLEAAAEERYKTLADEQKKLAEEQEERMQRVTDDLKKQLDDEKGKVQELKGKDADIQALTKSVTELQQKLEDAEKQRQLEIKEEALKKAEAELKKAEEEKQQVKAQLEAALKQEHHQPQPQRKITLPDEDKKKIAKKWFNGTMPDKDKVMKECQRLNLGTPLGGSLWRAEEVWIHHFGEQLYLEGLVTLTQTYDIKPWHINVHRV